MSNDFQKRLFEYEESPSPRNWQKIVAALEEGNELQSKLYNYQQQPAPGNWNKIQAALEQHKPARVISFQKRYSKYLKYGAAAAILALVLFASNLVLEKKAEEQRISNAPRQIQPPERQAPVQSPTSDDLVTDDIVTGKIKQPREQITAKDVAVAKLPANPKGQKMRAAPRDKNYLDWINPQSLAGALVTPEFASGMNDKILSPDLSLADRFMIYCCDSYGKPVRVPKKMFDKMHCADSDAVCRENLTCLQEKVSSVSLSADFLGVLQILREVQENK